MSCHLVAFVAAAQSDLEQAKRLETLVAAVQQAEQAKDYPRLSRIYAEMAGLRPREASVHRGLGLSYYLRGEYSEAISPLETAASLDGSLPGVALYLGISYYRENRFSEAEATLQKAPEIGTRNHLPHYWLGASRRALERFPEAIESFEAARGLAPKDLEVLHLLARARAEYAAELRERLLAFAPDSAYGRLLRAKDLAADGVYQAALNVADEALAEDPSLAEALVLRAEILHGLGKPAAVSANLGSLNRNRNRDEARRLAKALESSPRDAGILYELAETHDYLSRQTAERLFGLYPDSYRVRMLRGEAFEKSVRLRFDEALDEYRKAAELKPNERGVHAAIGRVLWRMNRFEEAVPHLERELRLNPKHGTANFLLGRIHLDRGEPEPAIDYLRSALKAQPGSIEVGRALAQALVKQGRYKEGIAAYQALLAEHPGDASIYALLAVAFRSVGKMDEAKSSAARARELRAVGKSAEN